MDGSVIEEKSSFKMLWLTFSSKLNWGSYIISIAKTASKKIGALTRSMKFFSPEVALYLYKSTIRPCMDWCSWLLLGIVRQAAKMDMRYCWSFTTCFLLLPVSGLSLFYRYYFGRCSSELCQLVPLPFSRGKATRYSDRLHDFFLTIR